MNTITEYRRKKDAKAYLEIILSLVTVSLFSIFALKPTFTTIASLLKEIQIKEETLVTLNTKIDNITRAQMIYRENEDRLYLIENALPPSSEPDNLVQQIETLAASHPSQIFNISTGKAPLSTGVTESTSEEVLSFTASINSDYAPLSNIISDLELFRRPIKIDAVQMKVSESENIGVVQLYVNGSTIYLSRPIEK